MKKVTQRFFSMIIALTVLVTIAPTKAKADSWDWFFDSDIKFYTHQTAEADTSVGRLLFAVNEDETTVSVVGSYILDKDGNIDDTQCDSIVVIPEKITYNKVTYTVTRTEGTFYNKKVESVTFPDSLIEIGSDTLRGTNVKEVNVTKNVAKIDPFSMRYNQYLTVLTVSKDNVTFASVSNVIYTKDGKSLVLAANLGKKVSVKNGIQKILANAFANCVYGKGHNDFVSILNELTLPSSITCLEEYSVRNDVLLIIFKGKLPKILCDITGEDGPILVVPASYVSAYKKISYNGNKIEAIKVTSTLSTKTAKANKKENDLIINRIDWKKATGKPNEFSNAQWKEFKTYYDNISKKYTSEEEKVNAILISVLNTYYVNDEYYKDLEWMTFSRDYPNLTTAYGVFKNPEKGTLDKYVVKVAIAALRTISSVEAVRLYPIVYGESSVKNDLILVRINDKIVIIDIAKEAGRFKEEVEISNLQTLQTFKYYDINKNLFNYSSEIFSIKYYIKGEMH